VLAPVPNLRAPIDWAHATSLLRDRIVAQLEARVLPGLSRHIVTERIVTPVDFATDYLSRHGAGFSVAPTLRQSAWLRFHNRAALPGLYLVGAGTHPGAGVPGVLTSAKLVGNLLVAETVR
jgi:phytoene desaturase